MAYGIVHVFAGGTREQYEASLAAVHPDKNTLPEGQIFHAAGPSDDGWTVVVVHDSKESWERFRDDVLMPRLKQGVQGGFAGPPRERTTGPRPGPASSGRRAPRSGPPPRRCCMMRSISRCHWRKSAISSSVISPCSNRSGNKGSVFFTAHTDCFCGITGGC